MYGNWKKAAALGLTVLLGCMVPMSTMLAAEDAETGSDSVSDNHVLYEEENMPGGETGSDVENVPEDGDVNADQMRNGVTMADPADGPDAETKDAEVPENTVALDVAAAFDNTAAPEIIITRGGQNIGCSLGGEIAFEYVNNWGPLFDVSVGQSEQQVSLFFYLDKVKDTKADAMKEEQMDSLRWGQKQSPPISIEPLADGSYVLYVKVEAGEKTYYARSSGVVVDTKQPVIKGIEEGKTYPEGTTFQVEDANLDSVFVNEQPVTSEDGSYKVTANGTSCVIRAKDKAGNETICSIIVFGSETPETGKVISESGIYELKAGVKYRLAEGKWKVDGDKSVYQGGIDFYVTADGSYQFTK